MSTSPSPRRSKPSTARPRCCPPTRSARRWPGCAASTTACSATASAPGPPSWTARSSRSAKPAPSSRPASSSAPPSKPSTTTPSPSTKTTAGSCSPRCSPDSTRTPHEPPATAPRPPRPAARARYRRRQPPGPQRGNRPASPGCAPPTGSATPPSGCTPWPASSPRPNGSCPRPSTTPATRNSPGPRSANSSAPPPPQRHAATGTSHDQLDKDHRHNADERMLPGLAHDSPPTGTMRSDFGRQIWVFIAGTYRGASEAVSTSAASQSREMILA